MADGNSGAGNIQVVHEENVQKNKIRKPKTQGCRCIREKQETLSLMFLKEVPMAKMGTFSATKSGIQD